MLRGISLIDLAGQTCVNQFWADTAPRFARDSNVLFELYNEPIATAATAQSSNTSKWNAVRGY